MDNAADHQVAQDPIQCGLKHLQVWRWAIQGASGVDFLSGPAGEGQNAFVSKWAWLSVMAEPSQMIGTKSR